MRTLSIFVLFFIGAQAFAQSAKKKGQSDKDDFIKKIDKVNLLLEEYRRLSPSTDPDNKPVIDSTSNRIISALLKILNDKQILKYKLENYLDENGLSISKSADNRIYFFSIDAKNGTSYRANKTIIHYRPGNGEVKAQLFNGEASEALATSSYGKVYLLDSLKSEYFVIGKVLTCNTCIASLAITLKLDSNSIKTELIAQYDGRTSNLVALDFNPAGNELYFEYYTADKEDAVYATDGEKPQFLHRYKSKFKYLFGELSEIERCEFFDKKE